MASATHYLPPPGAILDAWQGNFVAYVAAHWSERPRGSGQTSGGPEHAASLACTVHDTS